MRTIHTILAVRPRLFSETLSRMLPRECQVHVVAEADDELAIATQLISVLDVDEFDVDDLVVVIMSINQIETIPAVVSRLLSEFPELTLIGICPSPARIRTFQMQIAVEEVDCTLNGLLDAIEICHRTQSP